VSRTIPQRRKRRGPRRHRPQVRADQGFATVAGPVTVRRRDGSAAVLDAYDEQELARIVGHRRPISRVMRTRVLMRDGMRCRYCGVRLLEHEAEIDHVIPVSLGGSSRLGNLVTSCTKCNARKGAAVWKPRPLDKHLRRRAVSLVP
jgi:5-methylcytosine-specific restriction endonuclease McrA